MGRVSLKIEDPLPLSDPVVAAATSALLLPIPGSVTGMQREVSKMGWMISKTTNIRAKNIGKNQQEMGSFYKIELL